MLLAMSILIPVSCVKSVKQRTGIGESSSCTQVQAVTTIGRKEAPTVPSSTCPPLLSQKWNSQNPPAWSSVQRKEEWKKTNRHGSPRAMTGRAGTS